jgi:dephospho-CoA kinase
VVVYDAALLVENGLHRAMQEVLLVAARPETQEARIVARDGLTPAQARERIASQLPLAEKRRVATVVFENNGTLEELRAQVDAFWHRVEPRLAAG